MNGMIFGNRLAAHVASKILLTWRSLSSTLRILSRAVRDVGKKGEQLEAASIPPEQSRTDEQSEAANIPPNKEATIETTSADSPLDHESTVLPQRVSA